MSVNRQSKKNHRNLKKKKKKKGLPKFGKILPESGKSRQDLENHAGL